MTAWIDRLLCGHHLWSGWVYYEIPLPDLRRISRRTRQCALCDKHVSEVVGWSMPMPDYASTALLPPRQEEP